MGGGNSLTYIKKTVTQNVGGRANKSVTVEIPTLTNLAFVYVERTSTNNLVQFSDNIGDWHYTAFGGGYIDFTAPIDQNNGKYYNECIYCFFKEASSTADMNKPQSELPLRFTVLGNDDSNEHANIGYSDDSITLHTIGYGDYCYYVYGTYNIYFIYK